MTPMLILLVLFLLIAPSPVKANDAEYSAYTGNPAPVENSDIRMVSEEITFYQKLRGGWHVTAIYLFENTTDEEVRLTMGYPEFEADEGGERFVEFETTVRDAKVDIEVKKSAAAKKGPWPGLGKSLGRVHLFRVTFAPSERVTIIHTFDMGASGSVAIVIESSLSYVTRTGAMWKGPIGRARFTIRTRDVFDLIAIPESYEVESLRKFVIQKGDEINGTELVLKMKNWTPTEDLHVAFLTDEGGLRNSAVGANCPTWQADWSKYGEASREDKRDLVVVSGLESATPETLRLCRNYVYAKYGYPFKDPKLRERFYGDVHIGIYPPDAALTHWIRTDAQDDYGEDTHPCNSPHSCRDHLKLIPFMVNPDYTPDMLSIPELEYVKALQAEENRRMTGKDGEME